jgi:electron-transferring-flavoprotein dehydrogenase
VQGLSEFPSYCELAEIRATEYAGLLGQACPAAVYEYADAESHEADAAGKKFIINSQNCIHVSHR